MLKSEHKGKRQKARGYGLRAQLFPNMIKKNTVPKRSLLDKVFEYVVETPIINLSRINIFELNNFEATKRFLIVLGTLKQQSNYYNWCVECHGNRGFMVLW